MAGWALTAFFALSLASVASAAPPANDNFANAGVLSGLPASVTGTNVDASSEPGEPYHSRPVYPAAHSVWWSWTAPSDGDVTIDTCASDFDTVLAVYTGTRVEALTRVASNDADVLQRRCRADHNRAGVVSFTAHSGQVYRIAVDGGQSDASTGNIALALKKSPQPRNDRFAKATVFEDRYIARTGTNVGGSTEAGEPKHAGDSGGHSVWWRWTASRSGSIRFATCDAEFETLLAVYTGDRVSALTKVESNAGERAEGLEFLPFACDNETSVLFRARVGRTYRIAVDGAGGAIGAFSLSKTPSPLNDDFVRAAQLSTRVAADGAGGNYQATRERGEPNHAGNAAGQSVWWRWTAPASGSVRVKTCITSLIISDTVVAVYTGDAVNALHAVASYDGAPKRCGPNSEAAFTARVGRTYRIAVDTAAGAFLTGGVQLKLRETATSGPTTGDDTLTGTSGPNRLCGFGGSDLIYGRGGDDTLFGDACGAAARLRRAGAGHDTLFGGSGDDRLFGGRGGDALYGGRGNDLLDGNTGQDRLRGGPGNDTIRATDGRRDRINCGPGRDRVRADNRDRLRGCELIRRQ